VPDRGYSKPQYFGDSRDAKNDSIWVRDAKYNAAGAMRRVAWALQNSKAIGQICEKPWKNQGFAAERTGIELLAVFPMFLESSKGTCYESLRAKFSSGNEIK
jgi:hypothetical protein